MPKMQQHSIQEEIATCGNSSTVTIGDYCWSNVDVKGIAYGHRSKT